MPVLFSLQDAIHRIKLVFNKEFEELFVKKEQEISKIKDKNKRIKKIIADLDVVEEIIEPSMGVAEKPETLLEVDDSEVRFKCNCCQEQVQGNMNRLVKFITVHIHHIVR